MDTTPVFRWEQCEHTETELEEQRHQLEEQRQEESLAWWRAYDAYLRTPEWKAKRERVLRRDGYICQACLHRPAVHVHHLRYTYLRNEPLFDLVSVCVVCHDALHPDKEMIP